MIDLHAHIDLYPDPSSIARRCGELGIWVLSVTNTPSAWERTAALGSGLPRIRTALGLHPQLARERKHELPIFRQMIGKTKYVGEVGLDGAIECKPFWSDQVEVFTAILDICSRVGGRVLSIHSRRAASEVLAILKRFPLAGAPVLHWFTGSHKELRDAIELGCWFSVGPAMLRSAKSREQVAMIPMDHVLTESDGPFAQQDGRPIHPWDVETTHSMLAHTWRTTAEEVDPILRQNLSRLGASVTWAPPSDP